MRYGKVKRSFVDKKVIKNCTWCNKPMDNTNRRTRKYCDNKCMQAAGNARKKTKSNTAVCANPDCKKVFERIGRRIFCCDRCKSHAFSLRNIDANVSALNQKKPRKGKGNINPKFLERGRIHYSGMSLS